MPLCQNYILKLESWFVILQTSDQNYTQNIITTLHSNNWGDHFERSNYDLKLTISYELLASYPRERGLLMKKGIIEDSCIASRC